MANPRQTFCGGRGGSVPRLGKSSLHFSRAGGHAEMRWRYGKRGVGGGRIVLMPLNIYQQAVGVQDWPFAAALSVVFTVSILAITYLLNSAAQRRMRGVDAA